MKPPGWPVNRDDHAHMRLRQRQNLTTSTRSKAEAWMQEHLSRTGLKWTRQAQWGFRLFDFWCHDRGVAVEVDGPEHVREIDSRRDLYNYHRSGIVVIRVRNFNEQDAARCLSKIKRVGSWAARRKAMGIESKDRSTRKKWQESEDAATFLLGKLGM